MSNVNYHHTPNYSWRWKDGPNPTKDVWMQRGKIVLTVVAVLMELK